MTVIEFVEYVNNYEASCMKKFKELLNDGRTDEANFEKIKASICPIVLAFVKKENDLAKAKVGFMRVCSNWENNLERAIKNNDYSLENIERIKLSVRDEFVGLME